MPISVKSFSLTEPYLRYHYVRGYFFSFDDKDNKITSAFFGCRDQFRDHFTANTKMIGMSCGFKMPGMDGVQVDTINVENVDTWFTKIEDMLKLPVRTVLYRVEKLGKVLVDSAGHTQDVNINAIIVEPSPFWLVNDTRRSLFTLLLRNAVSFYDADMDKAFTSYELAKRMLPAIKWFLAGNTTPTYDKLTIPDHPATSNIGWVGEYQHATSAALAAKLVKPAVEGT